MQEGVRTMKELYTNPTAEIVLLQNSDVLTSSEEWTPGENETERAYSTRPFGSYPNY